MNNCSIEITFFNFAVLFTIFKAASLSQSSHKNTETMALHHIVFKSSALNLITRSNKNAPTIPFPIKKLALLPETFFSFMISYKCSLRRVNRLIAKIELFRINGSLICLFDLSI